MAALDTQLKRRGPQVKRYLQRQWTKIMAGRVSVQDFVFAKEVRLGTYTCACP